MNVNAINMSEVTAAVQKMLLADATLVALNTNVVRAEPVNTDVSLCPWIAVYKMGNVLAPHALGAGPGYRQQRAQLALVMQQTHPDSGEACEDLLEALVQAVVNVLLNDETLLGLVDVLDNIDVIYQK